MNNSATLLLELDKLKSVYRKSYLADGTRSENSAEHSWHLAMAFMAMKPILPNELNADHAIKLALVHDVCEIGPGDECAYTPSADKAKNEESYLEELKNTYPWFGQDILDLWKEYESQKTLESQWVKVFDKLLPFLLNLANNGRTWQEQNITKGMVVKHNEFIDDMAPEIYQWMLTEIDLAVKRDWLRESL
jgi:putative hydrolase of HD superfamily